MIEINLLDKVGDKSLEKRLQEAIDSVSTHHPEYDIKADFYVVRTTEELLYKFDDPNSETTTYPLDFNNRKKVFACTEGPDRWAAIILNNLKKTPVYMENIKASCVHEIGELVFRDEAFETQFEKNLEPYIEKRLGKYPKIRADIIVDCMMELKADDLAINEGYDKQILEIRKENLKSCDNLEYFFELGYMLPAFASLQLIIRSDSNLSEEARKVYLETKEKAIQQLNPEEALKIFSMVEELISIEAYKNPDAILAF